LKKIHEKFQESGQLI